MRELLSKYREAKAVYDKYHYVNDTLSNSKELEDIAQLVIKYSSDPMVRACRRFVGVDDIWNDGIMVKLTNPHQEKLYRVLIPKDYLNLSLEELEEELKKTDTKEFLTTITSDDDYCYDVQAWFAQTMKERLIFMVQDLHSYPGGLVDEEEWNNILKRMIFLLDEMSEDKCSKKNPYEEEYRLIWDDFIEKYGFFGEYLELDDEEEDEDDEYHIAKGPDDIPEEYPGFSELEDKYFEECKKINLYREDCKNEFMDLFKEYYWSLWD